jgi:subtilisin-like proprotein convertase family protein
MRIGRAALFLPGVIRRRMYEGTPGAAPTATRAMPIRRDLRRSTRSPGLRGLILLCVLSVLASLAVTASASAATLFTNPTPIKPPASSADFGPAAPYPSEIAVSGLVGPIANVAVTLHRVGHTRPDDLDILLVSPAGDNVMLMSDACGDDDIEDFTWTFTQLAPRAMSDDSSDCGEFAYRPTNYVAGDGPNDILMTSPAPPGPHGTSFASFNNENPNGTWKLYVRDDAPTEVGDIEGGWSLSIETGPVDVTIPGTGTSGPASPYPATRTISGHTGLISDLNVSLDGIWHQRPEDLDLLLVGPQGEKVVLMSDACGPLEVTDRPITGRGTSGRRRPRLAPTRPACRPSTEPTRTGSGACSSTTTRLAIRGSSPIASSFRSRRSRAPTSHPQPVTTHTEAWRTGFSRCRRGASFATTPTPTATP